jgi:sulfide:quinone oxidoreductase
MTRIIHITPQFAVTGVLFADDIVKLAGLGYRSILSNLPDGERPNQLPSAREASLAAAAGLSFRHIPVRKADIFLAPVVVAVRQALAVLPGPIVAHCASGQRSALAWAAAAAGYHSVDRVLAHLARVGLPFEALREELASLPGPPAGALLPAALDWQDAKPEG